MSSLSFFGNDKLKNLYDAIRAMISEWRFEGHYFDKVMVELKTTEKFRYILLYRGDFTYISHGVTSYDECEFPTEYVKSPWTQPGATFGIIQEPIGRNHKTITDEMFKEAFRIAECFVKC